MGSACTKSKPDSVGHPITTVEAKKNKKKSKKEKQQDQNQSTQNPQNQKGSHQNEDLISIVSLKSRQSMKKQVNIGFYLVQDVKKLEKDNKKVINQWKKTLSLYEKERQKEIRKEKIFTKKTENVLFSFKKNKFSEFQALIEAGIPLNLRWNVWKVQLFNQDIYDEQLYEKLLEQPIDEHYEIAILKDLPRTFPTHPYFQNKEIGGGGFLKLNQLNEGQRQLYNVLKALSIHMPNVGYTQGMNFVVGFLLMMSAGNESESFWVFLLLARDSNFLFMGLFEETLPLMHVLICIFEKKLKIVLPELYDHFQNILLDSMLWVWKWFITLFLYSFPIEIVAKLWDYIISNGGLSTISLGLALAEYYQKEFLKLDMEDIQILLREMKDTDMLLDKNSKFYLDFTKLQKLAKKYTISPEFASKCISDLTKEKKQDNMYSKFYIMRSKNESQATEWIHNSILERVKLSAAETVLHLGSNIKDPNLITVNAHININTVPNYNADDSIVNLVQMPKELNQEFVAVPGNQPTQNQVNLDVISSNINSNVFNQKLINQNNKNIQTKEMNQSIKGKSDNQVSSHTSDASPHKQSLTKIIGDFDNDIDKENNIHHSEKKQYVNNSKMQQQIELNNSLLEKNKEVNLIILSQLFKFQIYIFKNNIKFTSIQLAKL